MLFYKNELTVQWDVATKFPKLKYSLKKEIDHR